MNEDLKFWLTLPVPMVAALLMSLIGYLVGAAMGYSIGMTRFKMDKKAASKYEVPKGDA
jgi:membrane protein DedA with SNARE-associated domain